MIEYYVSYFLSKIFLVCTHKNHFIDMFKLIDKELFALLDLQGRTILKLMPIL